MSFDVGNLLGQLLGSATTDEPTNSATRDLPQDVLVDCEERAAILEHDGGLPRWQAEEQAFLEIYERSNLSSAITNK